MPVDGAGDVGTLIMALAAQVWPVARCTAAGVLGALANVVLEDEVVVLPRMAYGRLHLGFLGNLIVAVTMAHMADHDFATAFFAAVCGTSTLAAFKARIENAFEHEREGMGGNDDAG